MIGLTGKRCDIDEFHLPLDSVANTTHRFPSERELPESVGSKKYKHVQATGKAGVPGQQLEDHSRSSVEFGCAHKM